MQRALAVLVGGVAVLTAAVGLFGAVLGGRLVTSLGTSLTDGLALTSQALAAADSTIVVAADALDEVAGSMDGLATTSLIVGGSLENSHDLLAEVAEITGEDIPASLDSFRSSIPGLVRAASAIDRTLRALNLFTSDDYDPEVPLDEAISQLDEDLADLPDRLRRQAVLLERANDGMVGVTQRMYETARDVVDLRMTLTKASDVLAEYETTTADARELIAEVTARVEAEVPLARTGVVLMGVVLAVSQVGSGLLAWLLWSGTVVLPSLPVREPEPEGDTEEIDPQET